MPARRSYNWALHLDATDVEIHQLTPAALEGYDYAYELAEDAFDRSRDPRRDQQQDPLTLQQLADEYDVDPAHLARLIALARRQFFGNLTDAAIYKRLQRQQGRKTRRCAAPNCSTTIPVNAPANKKYCDHHATNAERVRRHRQNQTRAQAVMATPAKTHGLGHRKKAKPIPRLRPIL